jgi:hypothetical protein
VIATTWRHVRVGARVWSGGQAWEVTALSGPDVTMVAPDGRPRTGTPKPDGPVQLVEPWVGCQPATLGEAVQSVKDILGGDVVEA